MTPPMVERVARAMLPRLKPWAENHESWTVENLEAHGLMDLALAALRAMREPTPGMRWAKEMPHIGPDEIAELWNAMIDAAINEGRE